MINGLKFVMAALFVVVLAFGCKSNKTADNKTETVAEVVVAAQETPAAEAINIAFGDIDAMNAFVASLADGKYAEGQAVVIDGILSFGDETILVGQKNDGDEFVGTIITVDGWTDETRPADAAHVKVTAVLAKDADGEKLILSAVPENVVAVEEIAD